MSSRIQIPRPWVPMMRSRSLGWTAMSWTATVGRLFLSGEPAAAPRRARRGRRTRSRRKGGSGSRGPPGRRGPSRRAGRWRATSTSSRNRPSRRDRSGNRRSCGRRRRRRPFRRRNARPPPASTRCAAAVRGSPERRSSTSSRRPGSPGGSRRRCRTRGRTRRPGDSAIATIVQWTSAPVFSREIGPPGILLLFGIVGRQVGADASPRNCPPSVVRKRKLPAAVDGLRVVGGDEDRASSS